KPSDDTFLSASYFFKDVEDPIENIQRVVSFGFTTPVNYPEGQLSGFELEARQELGAFAELLEGFAVGANATFIDSEVTFPQAQLDEFAAANLPYFGDTRDATNAPESLYNLYATYDIADTQTQFALFYTVQGDTLVAGDSTSQFNYIPAIYQKSFGTLNASISQRLMKNVTLRLAASNLTNPSIDQVYRSPLLDGDTTFTSFTRGVEYSLGISANFSF
ncbi:MAG: TonB-dependent receptor, partial [Planctomycetota bacterium]|nr:TonB-dependent receptor [Planctomycetota bacterium]